MKSRTLLAQLAMMSAFMGGNLPSNKKDNTPSFEKLEMKGLSSQEMGTAGKKKLSRAKRKNINCKVQFTNVVYLYINI